jgi:hypothetical protein
MTKKACLFKFPIHPKDIMDRTPANVDSSSREVRLNLIVYLCDSPKNKHKSVSIDYDPKTGKYTRVLF